MQLALHESTDGAQQRDEREGADPAEQQLCIAFAFTLETEKQAEAQCGAETEGQIEIEHLVLAYCLWCLPSPALRHLGQVIFSGPYAGHKPGVGAWSTRGAH